MAGVGYVAQVLLADEVVVVKLPRVRQKKLVATGVDQKLGHGEALTKLVWLNKLHQPLVLGRVLPAHDAHLLIILHRRRVAAVGAVVVFERGHHVEHVDHDRHDGHHALVHRRHAPSGPAALGRASHHELVDRHGAALRLGQKIGDCVHRADASLGHWQTGRPTLVAGTQVLVPGVSDEGVLVAVAILAGETQRLVRHHLELRHHRSGFHGGLHHHIAGLGRRLLAVAAAGDHQHAGLVPHLGGLDDDHPVLPQRPIDIGLGQKRLRRHLEDVSRVAAALVGGEQSILVGRIRLGHVAVERVFLRACAWPSDNTHGQGEQRLAKFD